MSVYIDDFGAPYRGMKMCHMVADSTEELLAMADAIGVQRKWIQKAGTNREHFDVCRSKRELAIRNGAIAVRPYDIVKIMVTKMAGDLFAAEIDRLQRANADERRN